MSTDKNMIIAADTDSEGDYNFMILTRAPAVFSDVSSDHWAFDYIQKLRESGITTGYPDGTYKPENNVTRAEMAAFLARAFLGMP